MGGSACSAGDDSPWKAPMPRPAPVRLGSVVGGWRRAGLSIFREKRGAASPSAGVRGVTIDVAGDMAVGSYNTLLISSALAACVCRDEPPIMVSLPVRW